MAPTQTKSGRVRGPGVERAHLFGRPLTHCPACGSDRLEPIAESEPPDVHFLCRACGLRWRVELGFVHPVSGRA